MPAQVPYKSCHQVGTTSYSRNHKSGTEGAIIGGDLIERSNQPDYVAHHGSRTECETAYNSIQVPIGYQVQYMDNYDNTAQIITQHEPPVG